jgi:ERCC4-type nuclease
MTSVLIIDNREQALLATIKNTKYETLNLIHGDIIIKHQDDNVIAIFERKTLQDLLASIKDGRYRNQKKELIENYDRSVLYYIIEGDLSFSNHDENKITLGAIINILIRDDIKVFFTKNISDTCSLIENIYTRILENPEKYINKQTNEMVIKKEKKITKENFLRNTLCQVPGVSNKIASEISKNFSNLRTLNEELSRLNSIVEKRKLFENIKLNNNRAISKTSIDNIIEYLS